MREVVGRDLVGPAEVLGVPVLPPRRASRLTTRFRAGLARVHRGTAPPPMRLLEAALGSLDLAALVAICGLGLPERLVEPATCAQLAEDAQVDEVRLARLMRYAAVRGWVRIDRRDRVRRTQVTSFLHRDHPGGWRAWIDFVAGDEVAGAMAALDAGLVADGDAFATANGVPFFGWMQAHPDRHAVFDAAMAAGGRMHGLLLARALDWSSSRRVCDIGGGDGAALGVLLARHEHLEGVLLDLPDVVARAPRRPRCRTVGGDAFAAVPPGCDTYLLINVIHDWDDQAASRLLGRTAEAAAMSPPEGPEPRVVVLEAEAHARPRDDLAARADLLMLALTPGGRERTTEQITALAAGVGLGLRASHDLASGDVAHVFTRAAGASALTRSRSGRL